MNNPVQATDHNKKFRNLTPVIARQQAKLIRLNADADSDRTEKTQNDEADYYLGGRKRISSPVELF